jgi:radical SAM superfamily enzyme YgiQ (UPF0313 family)
MKILFANPPWWTKEPIADQPGSALLRRGIRAGSRWPFTMPSAYHPDAFKFGSYLPTPFFLGSAAAYVSDYFISELARSERVETHSSVEIRDSIARGESYQAFFSHLIVSQPDALVLETGAASWEHDLRLLGDIKRIMPAIRIAVAGPTVRSAMATTKPGIVDAWLIGEYEKNSLAFVRGQSGLLDFQMLTREEMSALPFPKYDEDVALNYWDGCPTGQQAPHLQMMTSRGCVYKCCFCAWPATMTGNDPDGTKPRSVRFHPAEWVEGFIRERMARAEAAGTPLKSIYLDDDTFNLSDKHTFAISAVMKRIGLPWSAMCRADTSSPEAWRAMKDAGCFGVKLGFESGSQRVVDEIVNKRLDIVKAAETARWLRKELGMTVHGTFTVGLPGETKAEQEETKEFIQFLYATGAIDTHQLSGTATIEGTPLDQIAQGNALKAFPGAIAGNDFVVSHDGVKKSETM